MKRHPSEQALNDYVDGLLGEPEREAVEPHLAECDQCRSAVEELRTLLARAAALPEIRPDRDLLPGIRAAARRRGGMRFGWIAVAATLVAAALAASVVFRGWSEPEAPGTSISRSGDVFELLRELREVEREYREASERLLAALDKRRGQLSPDTIETIEENIAIIDEAINEVHVALNRGAVDPGGAHILTALYQKKLQLLMKASRLSS